MSKHTNNSRQFDPAGPDITSLSRCCGRYMAMPFLLLALGLSGAAQGTDSTAPVVEEPVIATVGKLEFRECALTSQHRTRYVECAYLSVPEDYSAPDGRAIDLFIARLPARGSNVSADPLLAIAGGPGQSASESFLHLDLLLSDLARGRDIYLIDQRGTGRSHPQRCDLGSPQDAMLDFDPEVIRAVTRGCLEGFSGDPRQYTTSVAIRDFENVREALGVEAWNLFGISYGTRVAQHYMRRHPSAVRTAVLDAVAPPDMNLGPDIASLSQAALSTLFDLCAADEHCDRQFPDLRGQADALLARLEERPADIEYEDMQAGGLARMQYSRTHLVVTLRMVLYNTDILSVLPHILQRAYQADDFSALARLTARMDISDTFYMGMHNSVVCTEDVPFYQPQDRDQQADTYMGTTLLDNLALICAEWPRGQMDDDFKAPLDSAIPTLLLSGERDPITPVAYAERALLGLSASRHLIASGQGHGVAFAGCMPRILAQFVNNASTEDLRAECLNRLESAPLFLNVNGPRP